MFFSISAPTLPLTPRAVAPPGRFYGRGSFTRTSQRMFGPPVGGFHDRPVPTARRPKRLRRVQGVTSQLNIFIFLYLHLYLYPYIYIYIHIYIYIYV